MNRECKTCRYGPKCSLMLERYQREDKRWVCDPGGDFPTEKLRDVWEPRAKLKAWED